ncbi:hypothetical protein K435DRAFT_841273, partial [Dendrothele bispora CBS 962.96]
MRLNSFLLDYHHVAAQRPQSSIQQTLSIATSLGYHVANTTQVPQNSFSARFYGRYFTTSSAENHFRNSSRRLASLTPSSEHLPIHHICQPQALSTSTNFCPLSTAVLPTYGRLSVCSGNFTYGNLTTYGNLPAYGNLIVYGNLTVYYGNLTDYGNLTAYYGNLTDYGNLTAYVNLIAYGN